MILDLFNMFYFTDYSVPWLLMWPSVKRKVDYQRTKESELIPFLFAPYCAKYRFGTYKEPRHFSPPPEVAKP